MSRRDRKTGHSMPCAPTPVKNIPALKVAENNDGKNDPPLPPAIPIKRTLPAGLTNWLKTSIVPIVALCVSFAAYQNSRLTRADSQAKEARERAESQAKIARERIEQKKLNKQHVYQCYLLGKQLWEVEGEYVLFKDRRKRFDLPSDVAQALVVQQVEQTSHDLDLDVTATIEAIYNSKKMRTYDQEMQNHYTEKGIDAAADLLSSRIKAKYSEEAQTAFKVGRDVGWVLFLDKARMDHQEASKQFFLKHPERGVNPDEMETGLNSGITSNEGDALQGLNKQMKAWGSSDEFGRTWHIKKMDGSFRDYTVPVGDRPKEIMTFVGKIEDYLRN